MLWIEKYKSKNRWVCIHKNKQLKNGELQTDDGREITRNSFKINRLQRGG